MTISANYAVPVYVNGYACDNCAQVAEAKQGVDPANPQAGPYGVDASSTNPSPAVTFGGVLAGSAAAQQAGQTSPGSPSPSWSGATPGLGGHLDIQA